MTFAIGTWVGPYEILSPLGAGGMGEVYRGRDTRLNREVAIKVLPASFSNDADRFTRFEQEGRATSALNHPNILTVHDFGTHDGSPYLVAELLEGENLRAQLNEGAIAYRKAIDYAQQIASGLAAAHAKNIVHRDLKPENIFIVADGRVKILDFGLAKLRPQRVESADSGVATQKAITDPNTVMGTVGYMSPEQVRGQAADHRSDLFSFGVILSEMLSGRRAFTGDSAVEVMNAILKEEPQDLAETNVKVSPALDRIVRRCLEKKPEQRFQSTSDLCFAIEALSMPSGSRLDTAAALPVVTERTPAARLFGNERLAWIVAGITVLALLASLPFTIQHLRRAPVEARAMRFTIPLPEKVILGGLAPFWQVSVSPDGRYLAFVAASEGRTKLWVRSLDSVVAQPLAGTEGAFPQSPPFWSPDSRSIGFFAGGNLRRVEVTGGSPQTICQASQGRGGTWNRDGVIVFANIESSTLYHVSAAGGVPTPMTSLDPSGQEDTHRAPSFLPDGRHFLYFVRSAQPEREGIYVGSLDQKESKLLVRSETGALYAPPGYLLFVREETLYTQPFDADRLQVTGDPLPVAGQMRHSINRLAEFSVSDNGVLVYGHGGGAASGQLTWFDRGGKQLEASGAPGTYYHLELSPDEKRVAVEVIEPQTGVGDIWVFDLSRGSRSRLTSDPEWDYNPLWSPDGGRVAFASSRVAARGIYQKLASGAGSDELLFKVYPVFPTDWSRDGRFIVYQTSDPKTRADLWVLRLSGERQPRPFLQTEFSETQGRLSPDGRWMAYTSNESGNPEVYVQSFPASGAKSKVSTAGGAQPRWRADGKELFYLAADRRLMSVEVKWGAGFEAGVPKALFEAPIPAGQLTRYHYAVTADGQRFLIITPVGDAALQPLTVVVNWTAELKR